MKAEQKVALIHHVMGASHVFCATVTELQARTLAEATASQLTLSQVKLLLLIARPEHRFKVTDIAEFLDVTNAAASRSIDRLVQRGLVERTVSREDRRAVDLALTPLAEQLVASFLELRNRELLERLAEYPEAKLQRVASLLDELTVLLLDLESAEQARCLRCGMHFRSGCVLRDLLGRECAVAAQMWTLEDEHEAPLAT